MLLEDLAVPGCSSQIQNDHVLGQFRAGKVVIFVLAASVLMGSSGSGWPLLASPAMASAAEAGAFDALAKDIEKSVTELGYPKEVGQDLVRLVRDWKCEVWRQTLTQARQRYQQKQISAADVARVEQEVAKGLSQTIGKNITTPSRVERHSKYFYLSKVVRDKKAQCLGFAQLVYILGNSIGLRVTAIGVQELATASLLPGTWHMACFVELTDGKVMMVDLAQRLVSKSFLFSDTYRAAGNYWELKQKDSPLGIHRRIQILNKSGLVAGIYVSLGDQYSEAGDHDMAISCLTRAIELNPTIADAYCNRGAAYADTGQLAKAISDHTKAIELNPELAIAYSNRGNAYSKSGQLANALSDYAKAIELNPKYAEAYCNRGAAYAQSGQLANALSDLAKAIELNPKDAEAYSNRGNAYADSGQLANALSDYTKAIELNPKFANAHGGRGLANAKMGKTAEAKKDLQRAVELNPALKETAKRLSDQFKLGL